MIKNLFRVPTQRIMDDIILLGICGKIKSSLLLEIQEALEDKIVDKLSWTWDLDIWIEARAK